MKVADEVWVATALLHREFAERSAFDVAAIKAKALEQRQRVTADYRDIASVYVHALQHAVANLPVNGGAYRLLFATSKKERRLYRPGDPCDPRRANGKSVPAKEDLPQAYWPLLGWYANTYTRNFRAREGHDPILALRGLGKELWQDEQADAYVNGLRRGWQ